MDQPIPRPARTSKDVRCWGPAVQAPHSFRSPASQYLHPRPAGYSSCSLSGARKAGPGGLTPRQHLLAARRSLVGGPWWWDANARTEGITTTVFLRASRRPSPSFRPQPLVGNGGACQRIPGRGPGKWKTRKPDPAQCAQAAHRVLIYLQATPPRVRNSVGEGSSGGCKRARLPQRLTARRGVDRSAATVLLRTRLPRVG